MEKRKNMLTSAKLCRFCLAEDVPLISLYEKKQPKNAVPLSTKILTSISVEVFPSDRMPTYICHRCNFFMDVCHTFKDICREADRSIMQFVQTGTALEPTVWPPSLVKLFRYGAKSSPVVKTVVEGGATVEVSQDLSDSEDDEEDFYSVKIRDGTEDSSACIKVVTSKENDGAKEKKKKARDCTDLEAKQSTALPSLSIPGGCWACDECECAFPLQQLLELHKMQKHRTRTVACDLCDAKFFSKYELSAHLSQHSTDLPFACVACEKRFKRLLLLKRHERLTHSDLPQHKCPYCPASFLAEEECAAHQLRHQPAERKYNCNLCDKSFLDRRTLQKHTDAVHLSSSNETLACEYCPERFQSLSRLTRHVRTHAGDRPYPCKHCDKSFSKGYHLQRHLRVKHAEVKPESAEEYPCEQCAASFGTQDDLIYHSAIHATQNFTCPLCQEKFDDVDAVTTHIKSHVTESEFMCDFCELVFTTKEKLDIHVVNSHNDELNSQEMGADESSMEMDAEEEDDKNAINVTEEGDHMLVEIKKPNNFMLSNTEEDSQEKTNNTNSEESEPESAMTEPLPQESPLPMIPIETETPLPKPPTLTPAPKNDTVMMKNEEIKANSILRKAEEIQRKAAQLPSEPVATEKKVEKAKVETNNSGGANDKSLRLLEKELQDLQRTNKREDASKTPVKTLESLRSSRRPQIHTSTPKIKPAEEKKSQASAKTTPADKRAAEKRGVKENKKPEDSKETKTNNVNNVSAKEAKEDKEVKAKEEKESKTNSSKEESKEKSTVKNVSNNNQSGSDESVRRSSRASKVKDYAKMVRDNRPVSVSEEDTDDDEDYVEVDEVRPKTRRVIQKPPPKQQTPTKATPQTPVKTPARKRGRPRKDQSVELPTKLKKDDNKPGKEEKMDAEESTKSTSKEKDKPDQKSEENTSKEKEKEQKPEMEKEDLTEDSDTDTGKSGDSEQKPQNSVVAPTGQMLKKVPIKALPPGVKPLPLPSVALPTVRPSEVCEMQIGKKVMKVQKIVMTKAQVEAMTKKGLVEMKDGTMVLKQGVKLPTEALKTTLVGEGLKREKGAPTRCDLEDM